MSADGAVLVLNSGSSSLKYQLLHPDSGDKIAVGMVDQIGSVGASAEHQQAGRTWRHVGDLPDHHAALTQALAFFTDAGTHLADSDMLAVGHRTVHGGQSFSAPTLVDDTVIGEIDRLASLAPLHNPVNLMGIRAMRELLPDVPAVCVFDTAFFHDLPARAATYAIDRSVAATHHIRRYGFHGTSHEYVSGAAADFLGVSTGQINQIVLHLGNGASASAIRGGRPVDTTMGLTPLEGLVMGTRSGDIDPAIVMYLRRVSGMDIDDIDRMLNSASGLKGLCGENDFRAITDLVEAGDPDARLAYDVYIHRLRRYLGAYLIELGRVDAIVFTAGVGENAAAVRRDALADLQRFGIVLDDERNTTRIPGARRISSDDSEVSVLVVPTNEELAIARQAAALVRAG
ncbi:acetate kinase [Williamsia sp. CHRR-6]|uniref:acetate kinase n=1 Tax=Williamsia sp. CHRR-6 TaxID=2835871 RepID=UPI001BD994DF|nr:acetate kinase [Williamsia sp. CHRR-6]MBT0567054.1 acetate kinase [Williamsia sp. CHRR-6]